MRTISKGLGLAGGCIALILAVIIFLSGAFITYMMSELYGDDSFAGLKQHEEYGDTIDYGLGIGGLVRTFGVILILCGMAGIVGGIIVKKQNIAAGIVMLVASIPALVTVLGILPGLLLLTGGIFALVKEKEPSVPIQA